MSEDEAAVRMFKTAWFKRFTRPKKISDKALKEAITRAEKGSIDADLGGYVIKQRIARPGQGKSGGYRTVILFKKGDKAFFVFGFAKSKQENIDQAETDTFKKAAKELLALSDEQIQKLIENGEFTEVKR